MRGSDLLIKTLSNLQVNYLFTLSGNQIMPVFDSALDSKIKLIHFRHEAAAVHAADTWGRLTNTPGMAIVSAGPGFANTLSALYVAMSAESPLVLLSGNAQLSDQNRGAFQEMPQADMARSVTKSSWTCTNTENIQHDIERAYEIANTGRPGPVHIALPVDILEEKLISNKSPIKNQTSNGNLKSITKSEFEKIMDALQSAKRPLILAGQAISRKGKKILLDLSLSSKIPIVNMESPRGVNDPSLGSFSEVLKEADLIFLLGKKIDFGLKFGDDSTLSSNANIVQIDYDKSVLEQGKKAIYPPERIIVSSEVDPLLVIKKIVEVKEISVNNVWVNQVQSALKYNPPEWAIQKKSSEDGPIHPLTVCSIVQNMLNKQKDSVFISDGGEFGQWTQACISAPNRIINGPAGAIGASIPTAIAASIAHPEKTIIAMLGDGTFGFHGMEFDTAVRYNLPFIAIIGNDARWNAEYQIQLNNYGSDRTIGCELHPSRYDLVVKALGGHGENVTTASELAPALDRALNSGLPACINVSIQPIKAPIIKKT